MNVTPLMGLPYPNGLDAPCDFDDDWCAFTAALDSVFAKFETGLQRTYPAIPIAVVQLTTTITILNFNPVPWDTVAIDTAGMTDLDADPYGIVLPRSGRYTAAAFLQQDTSGIVDSQSVMTIQGFSERNVDNIILNRGAGIPYYNNCYQAVISGTQGTRLTLTTFVSGASSRTARGGWMAIYWHSDSERPS